MEHSEQSDFYSLGLDARLQVLRDSLTPAQFEKRCQTALAGLAASNRLAPMDPEEQQGFIDGFITGDAPGFFEGEDVET
jgi:hypothetical protein